MMKRCPKCHGNVYLDEDEHGWFEHCLQCGYTCDLQGVLDFTERQALKNRIVLPEDEADVDQPQGILS